MTPNPRLVPLATRLLAAGTVPLLVLAACSGSGDDERSAATTTTSAPAARPAPSSSSSTAPVDGTAARDAELVAAVRAFWDLYLELGARTGPFDATATRDRLATRTTGKELTALYDALQGNAVAGYVVRGTIDIAPTVVSVTGKMARVSDCYDDRTGLYRASDGQRVDTDDPRRHKVLMTLVRSEGAWKVSAIADEGLGCAA
jgi:hypothetical protein